MILTQRILLANIFLLCFSTYVSLAKDSTVFDMVDEDIKSPFSVLNEDVINSDNNFSIINQNLINDDNVIKLEKANIRVLDYNTGQSKSHEINIGEIHNITEKNSIYIYKCLKEGNDVLNPLNMALISIDTEGKNVYLGWIFTKITSSSLPKINNNFIYLSNCS
ncbi:MAG: hypothetical protein ACI8ZF_000695 [Candidatus Midichloriaceae bacterium]|jgi:hypothetical protein